MTVTSGSACSVSDAVKLIVTVSPAAASGGITVRSLNTGAVPRPLQDALFAAGWMGLPRASRTPDAVSVSGTPERISPDAHASATDAGPPDTPVGEDSSVPVPRPNTA
ncbi:MAG: hypothetical protein BWX80_03003 [Candidatus Hydrogenedentes bacterium ADurb.Bin101]|nr:MAG: hypothetical protein BWX80_03003 [Candidatus Hydrogenedentes bacterium ADurb.Bin101]